MFRLCKMTPVAQRAHTYKSDTHCHEHEPWVNSFWVFVAKCGVAATAAAVVYTRHIHERSERNSIILLADEFVVCDLETYILPEYSFDTCSLVYIFFFALSSPLAPILANVEC